MGMSQACPVNCEVKPAPWIACPAQVSGHEIHCDQSSSISLPGESGVSIILERVQLQMTESSLASGSKVGFVTHHLMSSEILGRVGGAACGLGSEEHLLEWRYRPGLPRTGRKGSRISPYDCGVVTHGTRWHWMTQPPASPLDILKLGVGHWGFF